MKSFAQQPTSRRFSRPRGFTLLELCIVMFIMVLLAGVATPALRSAFVEQGLRDDAGRISFLVRKAMLTSREQGRSYRLQLNGTNLSLTPVPTTRDDSKPAPAPAADETNPESDPANTVQLRHAVLFPDSEKKDKWESLPSTSWLFEPNELCPLPRLRLQDSGAYVEISFDALTGDVEDEATYIP